MKFDKPHESLKPHWTGCLTEFKLEIKPHWIDCLTEFKIEIKPHWIGCLTEFKIEIRDRKAIKLMGFIFRYGV